MKQTANWRRSLAVSNFLIVLALLVAMTVEVAGQRERTIQQERDDSRNLAEAVAQYTVQVMDGVDSVLQDLIRTIALLDPNDPRRNTEIHLRLSDQVTNTPHAVAFIVIDSDGTLSHTSRTPHPEVLDFSDREYHKVHRDDVTAGLHLSAPFQGRVGLISGVWVISASRAMVDYRGNYAGSVVALLSLDLFRGFYSSIDVGAQGQIALSRLDGQTVLSIPVDDAAMAGERRILPPLEGEAGSVFYTEPDEGVRRLLAYRVLSGYPLAVTVGKSVERILAERWRPHALRVILLALALSLAVALLTIWLVRADVQRSRAQEEAREGESRMRTILEAAPDPILSVDSRGVIEDANTAAAAVFGIPLADFKGRLIEAILPALRQDESGALRLSSGAVPEAPAETLGRRGDGGVFPAEISVSGLRSGALRRSIVIVRDVTARREAEEELRESERRLRSVIDVVPHMIFARDATGRYRLANRALARLYDRPVEDVLGRVHEDLAEAGVPPPSSPSGDREVIADGQPKYLFEETWHDKDGREHVYQTSKVPFRLKNSSDVMALSVMVDVTERKQADQALRRAQKMEAIGQLTGGIAHDFNNLLGIIIGNLDLLERQIGQDETVLRRIRSSQTAAMRGSELTKRLLAFSRQTPQAPQVCELGPEITRITEILRQTFPKNIKIIDDIPETLWSVDVDPGDLGDALLNLAINSRHAMPEGGRLVIEARNKVLDEHYAERNPDAVPGDYVVVSLTDTGVGIPRDIQEKVFEPFFTTKPAGTGNGLGLSMVYGFVKRSRGHVKIYSEVGRGTSVRLYLPRSRKEPADADQESRTAQIPGGGERILVVDDEQDILFLAESFLNELGYETRTADGPASALELLRAGETFDLLFSDVVMPGPMDGFGLAKASMEIAPSLKVLLTSGFARTLGDEREGAPGSVRVLGKPYRKAELAAAVREALEDGRKEGA